MSLTETRKRGGITPANPPGLLTLRRMWRVKRQGMTTLIYDTFQRAPALDRMSVD
jgi:hypothetical protein